MSRIPDFIDSDGIPRYKSVHGCNLYGSATEALRSAKIGRRRSATQPIHIFKTTDGLFAYSARVDGQIVRNVPELRGAVLVETFDPSGDTTGEQQQ